MSPACARRRARRSSPTASPSESDILVEHLEAQWRHRLCQVEHAGIRRRRQHLQRSLRPRRSIRGTRRAPPPAPRAARRWRWPPARPGWRTAPTWAAACAIPRASAASSACGRRPAGSRTVGRGDRPQSRRRGPDGAQRRRPGAAARCHERRSIARSHVAAGAAESRFWPPRVPAASRSASPFSRDLGITPVDPEVARHHPQGGAALCEAGRRSSRKPIPICARRMNASTCCARFDFAPSQGGAAARPSATSSSPR